MILVWLRLRRATLRGSGIMRSVALSGERSADLLAERQPLPFGKRLKNNSSGEASQTLLPTA